MNKLHKLFLVSAVVAAGVLVSLNRPAEAQSGVVGGGGGRIRLDHGSLVWSPKSNLVRYSMYFPPNDAGGASTATVEATFDIRGEVQANGKRTTNRFMCTLVFKDGAGKGHIPIEVENRTGGIKIWTEDELLNLLGRDNDYWDAVTIHATFEISGLGKDDTVPSVGVQQYDYVQGVWKEYHPAKDQLKAKPRN